MTSRTEERLRDATRALAQATRPQDIPDLRLPEPGQRSASAGSPWRPSARWAGGRWLIPIAAAAAVLALIISLTVVGRMSPRPRPTSPPVERVRDMPAYLITARDGHGYVQATATGRVVARIPPPVRGFQIEAIAVQPGERTFYLAGDVPVAPPTVKIEFFKFTLDSRGRPGRPQRLGAPVIEQLPRTIARPTVIPMAISPDGRELAYAWPDQMLAAYAAHRRATITVQDVATGSRRTWNIWPALGTGINSLSFAAPNRLAFVAMIANAAVSGGTVVPQRDNQLNVFMILNLSAPGSSLVADSRLVTYGSEPYPPGTTGPWTGPYYGVISPDGHSAYLELVARSQSDRLVRMSVGTGMVTEVLVREGATAASYPMDIDGNQMLIFLPPRHPNASNTFNVCANLAGVNLSTGGISHLPASPSCPDFPLTGPFEAAW